VPAEIALVLGDQLTPDNPALARIDRDRDCVMMIEALGEARHFWSHNARIAVFLSAMRHFVDTLRATGFRVRYLRVDDDLPDGLPARFDHFLASHAPTRIRMCEPGERRPAFRRRATAGVRAVPGRCVEQRTVPLALAAVHEPQPETAGFA